MKNHVHQQLAYTSGTTACTQCKPITTGIAVSFFFSRRILIYYVVCPFFECSQAVRGLLF